MSSIFNKPLKPWVPATGIGIRRWVWEHWNYYGGKWHLRGFRIFGFQHETKTNIWHELHRSRWHKKN